jgi:hypothetical protein
MLGCFGLFFVLLDVPFFALFCAQVVGAGAYSLVWFFVGDSFSLCCPFLYRRTKKMRLKTSVGDESAKSLNLSPQAICVE